MEIVTTARQPAASTRSRLLVALLVFAPVTLFALLPVGLGFERYVVSGDSMRPELARGTMLIERRVPVGSLRIGDVITYRPPATSGVEGPVTRRIVELDGDLLRTQGDAEVVPDAYRFRLDEPTQPVVVAVVPYIGLLYLGIVDPGLWTAVLVLSLLVLLCPLLIRRLRPRRVRAAGYPV